MTTAPTHAGPAADEHAGDSAAVTAGTRGATRVADRVVAKIAAQAAREALREASDTDGEAHAGVTVHHRDDGADRLGEARVHVTVTLSYPADIGARCGAVRSRVTERVTALAAMDVSEVAVTVERLQSPHSAGRGTERVR